MYAERNQKTSIVMVMVGTINADEFKNIYISHEIIGTRNDWEFWKGINNYESIVNNYPSIFYNNLMSILIYRG